MKSYIAADNMITSLGFSTMENLQRMSDGLTGICKIEKANSRIGVEGCVSLVDIDRLDEIFSEGEDPARYTLLERMAIISVKTAAEETDIDPGSSKTLFIFSTTKGNIDLLSRDHPFEKDRLQLWKTAGIISGFFQNPNQPLVVSNACISGLLALLTGTRILESGKFEHIVVIGGDLATEFVVSGFQSFKALSQEPCKPYDENRKGLSLGEGCGTVLLTSNPALAQTEKIVIRGGASANDANHISGPSPEGEGLFQAIEHTLHDCRESRENIDYISAHGTATIYNDNMESQALNRANLGSIPVNSLKGFFGHTLGAAGVLESVAAIQSLRQNFLIATKGFDSGGTVKPLNVISANRTSPLNHCLKLASGFGGCNASILISKDGTF